MVVVMEVVVSAVEDGIETDSFPLRR